MVAISKPAKAGPMARELLTAMRVERQRIQEVFWSGEFTHQSLARGILKGLHRADQEAGYVDMPGLDTIRQHERCQDEVESGVGDLSDDELRVHDRSDPPAHRQRYRREKVECRASRRQGPIAGVSW